MSDYLSSTTAITTTPSPKRKFKFYYLFIIQFLLLVSFFVFKAITFTPPKHIITHSTDDIKIGMLSQATGYVIDSVIKPSSAIPPSDVYLVCGDNILKIGTNGIISRVTGSDSAGYSGDGGPAFLASLRPQSITADKNGNLFIADIGNNRIRKIDAATGIITTVAGTGALGFNGDGILATKAELSRPTGVAIDNEGNVFIADRENNRIRKIDAATGIITTVAGSETPVAGYATPDPPNTIGDGGLATSAKLNMPEAIVLDSANNLYIMDVFHSRIRKVAAITGIITTIAMGSTSYDDDIKDSTIIKSSFLDFEGGNYEPRVNFMKDGNGNLYIARNYQRPPLLKVNLQTRVIIPVANVFGNTSGIDAAGNLYVVYTDGSVHKITFNPVPPPLTRFSALEEDDRILLQWETSNETNTDKFIIQISKDGNTYYNVDTISSNGKGNNYYNYSDNSILTKNPTIYYRLEIIGTDGSIAYTYNNGN